MRRSRYRTTIANLSLVLLSLMITLGVAELSLRVIGYDVLSRLKSGRDLILQPSSNPDIRYELRPGAKGYAWGTNVEINAHGYRGRMGVPGTFRGFRIIVIGDSITFGNFLPLESIYAHQLHDILNKSDSEYEVLNFGVGGYDTLQEVALLEHRGLAYKPELVVVGFCLNDIGVVSANLEYIDQVQGYRSKLIFRSRLAQLVADRIDRIRIGTWMKGKNRPEVFKRDFAGKITRIGEDEHELFDLMRRIPDEYPSNWYRSKQRVGRLRHAFELLSELAKRENFSVVVLIIPRLIGNSNSYPHQTAHQIVTLEAKRVNFDILEIVQDFMDAGMDNLKISKRDDMHPNERGHRIIAEKLAGYVRDKNSGTIID